MVASTHWLASAAGMAVLDSGGNAFDAAVAAGLTLQIVEPHLNCPGGEVPVLAHPADRDETDLARTYRRIVEEAEARTTDPGRRQPAEDARLRGRSLMGRSRTRR